MREMGRWGVSGYISRLAWFCCSFFLASISPAIWFFFLHVSISIVEGEGWWGALSHTVWHRVGLDVVSWRSHMGFDRCVRLTDDSLHLRELSRILLDSHCGCVLVLHCTSLHRVLQSIARIFFVGLAKISRASAIHRVPSCHTLNPSLIALQP